MRQLHAIADDDIDQLTRLYEHAWWAVGRTAGDVRRALAHSIVVAFTTDDGRLVAFGRAVTDHVYKALLFDIIVAPEHRDTGLGKRVVEGLLAHEAVAGAAHIELYCAPEMIPFYERWGFSPLAKLTFMRKDTSQ